MSEKEKELKMFAWYHGPLGRETANQKMEGSSLGSFLVRKREQPGCNEYVLTVSETHKISHYMITDVNGIYYKIGEQRFADVPSIVEFYKNYMLDTTALTTPVHRPPCSHEISNGDEIQQPSTHPVKFSDISGQTPSLKVKAKFNFLGNDPEDLPFSKGDVMTVIKKEEDKWWLAQNDQGREGMIPVPYIEVIQSPT